MNAFKRAPLRPCAQLRRILLVGLSLALLLRATGISQEAPLVPLLTPNALQHLSQPMTVSVVDPRIAQGETLSFTVLKNCQPGKQGRRVVPVSLYEWKETASDAGLVTQLDFQKLVQEGIEIPAGEMLCVRASSKQGGRPAGLAVFALVDNPCSFLQSVLGSLLGGRCTLGLLQSLRDHRGARVPDVPPVFEVGRLPLTNASSEPSHIPGTLGATGVAWRDDHTLVVTIGDPPETVVETQLTGLPTQETPLPAGVYLVSADKGRTRALWTRPAGESREPAAPLVMPDGRIAFVLQARPLTAGADDAISSLRVLRGNREAGRALPLPYRVHQMFALGDSSVLALTLGSSSDRPTFFQVFTDSHEVRVLGYQSALYDAVHRSRDGSRAVIEFEDNSGQNGWDLVLVGTDGSLQRELLVRPEHDMLPAWSPDGGELAFLAERAAAQ